MGNFPDLNFVTPIPLIGKERKKCIICGEMFTGEVYCETCLYAIQVMVWLTTYWIYLEGVSDGEV